MKLRKLKSGWWSLCLLPAALLLILLAGCSSGSPNHPSPTGNIASDAVHDYGQNIHSSLEAGKKVECQSDLQQLRTAIQMQKDSTGQYPASLADLGTQMTALETCPSSGRPYQYDPSTGKVWCTTPGHEKL